MAVIAFTFDNENNLILQRRGPECKDEIFKLEGIGGGVKNTDIDFRSALRREIIEEVGTNANIEIKEFIAGLGENILDVRDNTEKFWILLAYRGVLKSGELQVLEPTKNLGHERYQLDQVNEDDLGSAAKKFYDIMKERYI